MTNSGWQMVSFRHALCGWGPLRRGGRLGGWVLLLMWLAQCGPNGSVTREAADAGVGRGPGDLPSPGGGGEIGDTPGIPTPGLPETPGATGGLERRPARRGWVALLAQWLAATARGDSTLWAGLRDKPQVTLDPGAPWPAGLGRKAGRPVPPRAGRRALATTRRDKILGPR